MIDNKISGFKINVDNGLLEKITINLEDIYLTRSRYSDEESDISLINDKKIYRYTSYMDIETENGVVKYANFFSDSDLFRMSNFTWKLKGAESTPIIRSCILVKWDFEKNSALNSDIETNIINNRIIFMACEPINID